MAESLQAAAGSAADRGGGDRLRRRRRRLLPRHGIAVANIRDYAVHSVPEHAFAMILALRRNMIAYRDDVLHGAWEIQEQFCFS